LRLCYALPAIKKISKRLSGESAMAGNVDLLHRRVERPWLVNLQWALALICGAVAVWALGGP
jgi:hypothetical protein